MSSSSPTPSPSSLTPTNKSPQLPSSARFRSSYKGSAFIDEEGHRKISSDEEASPRSHLTPPGLFQAQPAKMSAAPISPQFGAGSSSSTSIGSSPKGMSSSGIGNGKAGISMVPSGSPTSNISTSRSPPYYNDLGMMRTSSGSKGPPLTIGEGKDRAGHRKRSSSLVIVEKIATSHEEMLDQSAGFNANADWVNYKGEFHTALEGYGESYSIKTLIHEGAWVIHVVLILLGKILVDVIPGMEQDTSWTIVNLGYIAISYLMFHYVTGTPFESNNGVFDELTLWEQIDEGAQYTPTKKWLTSMPIVLFLVSTHYTKYNPWLFSLNFCALLFVLFPKLPLLHRLRFKVMPCSTPHTSNPPTPTHSRPNSAAGFR